MSIQINIGCGQTPTDGWKNYDNSWSIRLSKKPLLFSIASKLGLISKQQKEFIAFAKDANIYWADAVKNIPEKSASVSTVYSSHMVEHIERADAIRFLREAHRILENGGVVRISVPDIRCQVDEYIKNGDADEFIEKSHLTRRKPGILMDKIKYLITGDRNHQWMYDGNSLCKLLREAGYQEPRIMEPGSTMIPDSGALDLYERAEESVFVEAVKNSANNPRTPA